MALVNPQDTLERQNEKLLKIAESLMRRVEEKTKDSGLAYAQFERAALLEQEVRRRTEDLEHALDLLHDSNAQLSVANQNAEVARLDLADAIETVDGGFALFGPNSRLVMANSRFCGEFVDVRNQIKPGLAFECYVKAISRSSQLALPDNMSSEDWTSLRLKRHGDDQVAFNVRLTANRWVQVSEHRTGSGGTVILQMDVTDLMRSQREEREKLRDTQARHLQATLDHLDQGVCIFDNKQKLRGWNRRIEELLPIADTPNSKLMELPFSELIAHFRAEFQIADTQNMAAILEWADGRVPRRPMRFEIKRTTGQILGVFGQEMPERGFVISFTDVTTERKAASDLASLNAELENRVTERTNELNSALKAAERANAARTRFVAAASHDLLQPLSAAKLFIQSIPEASPEPSVKESADKAIGALANAEKIIEALLDISRLDVEELPFSIEAVSLTDVMVSIAEELAPVADAKGLKLRCVDCSLAVISDPSYLRRIVQNLAVNAVRYTKSGGVVIGVRREASSVRLEVWDSGPGIADKDLEHVFQEFKRLDPNNADGGLGLGLAIVSRACARLGHKLNLTSTQGKGSCFSVTLPIAKGIESAETLNSPDDQTPGKLNGSVVLVVENDDLMNVALTTLIEGWGGHVISAKSGEEAIDILSEIDLAPDAILLDHQLDGALSGIETYRQLISIYGKIPARVITAFQDTNLVSTYSSMGLQLTRKPIEKSDLKSFLECNLTGD